jgi:hypothetical protein
MAKVDLGPDRFFSSDPRVNKVWLEIIIRSNGGAVECDRPVWRA